MITSVSLGIYLIVGLLYGNHQYSKMVAYFSIDSNDLDEDEQKITNVLYNSFHQASLKVGDKGLKALFVLIFMFLWLPIAIWIKVKPSRA